MPSPDLSADAQSVLALRAAALPVVAGKHPCHSELIADADEARRLRVTLP